jgi:hypothetical protein
VKPEELKFLNECLSWNIRAFEAVDALIETGTLRQVAMLGLKHNQMALERLEQFMKSKSIKPLIKNQRDDIAWLERLWQLGDDSDNR